MNELDQIQRQLCESFGVEPFPIDYSLKVGIARNVKEGILPINGVRIPPEGDLTGWFIWAGGEMSQDPDFFVPLHAAHLPNWCPWVLKFLQLPPGWHFLTDGKYEDVWFTEATLDHAPE